MEQFTAPEIFLRSSWSSCTCTVYLCVRVCIHTYTNTHLKYVTKTNFCSDLFQPGSKLLEADLLNMKSLQLFSQLAVFRHLLTKVSQSLNNEKVHNLSNRTSKTKWNSCSACK